MRVVQGYKIPVELSIYESMQIDKDGLENCQYMYSICVIWNYCLFQSEELVDFHVNMLLKAISKISVCFTSKSSTMTRTYLNASETSSRPLHQDPMVPTKYVLYISNFDIKNKTNHPMSNNSHPSAIAYNAIHFLK